MRNVCIFAQNLIIMKTKILYLEIIAAAVAVIGAIFYAPDSSFKIPSIVNTMVLLVYSLVCFFISMVRVNSTTPKDQIDNFFHKLTWLVFSIMSMGILFRIQHYPGAGVMLMVSGLPGVAILFYHLFNINKDKDKDPKMTPPAYDPHGEKPLRGVPSSVNQNVNTVLFKWFGERYSHLELVARLAIALAIVAKLYFSSDGFVPEVVPEDMPL